MATVGRKKDTSWKTKIQILAAKKRVGLASFFLFQQKCLGYQIILSYKGLAVLYWFRIGLVAGVP